MKRALAMATAILSSLFISCDKGDDNRDTDQEFNTSISPPEWIKGTWANKENSKLVFKEDDVIYYSYNQNVIPESAKEGVAFWLNNSVSEINVKQLITDHEYQLAFWIHTDDTQVKTTDNSYKKIDSNTIEYTYLGSNKGKFSRVSDNGNNSGGGTSGNQDGRLVGTWQNEGGTVKWTGTASVLKFLSANPTNSTAGWYYAIQNRFVAIGDSYIKDLEKISTNKYKCKALWNRRVNGVVTNVGFSSNMTLEISSNGKSLHIEGSDPWDGTYTSGVLTKL